MTDPPAVPADPGAHEWHRLLPTWHVAFGVLAALTAGLLLIDGGTGPARRVAGLALLAVLCAWYAGVGAGALRHEPSRRGVAYLIAAVPLTIGLFAASPVGALMLFMLYPHLWALLPARWAVAGTVTAVVTTSVVILGWVGLDLAGLGPVLVTAAAALLFAIVLGMWITRVVEQSRQRARLVNELVATRAELAEASRNRGIAEERVRLARDIHDTLAQGFTSVLLLLEAAEAALDRDGPAAVRDYLRRAGSTARENLTEARAMVAMATPPQLRDGSLPAALQQVVGRLDPELAGGVTLTVQGTPVGLRRDQEVVLLRAVQEALANTHKHAAATRAEVSLEYRGSAVRLRVVDDGRGFDPARRPPGFGLDGLRDRVDQVGGSMTVSSAPGAGVTLSVELAS